MKENNDIISDGLAIVFVHFTGELSIECSLVTEDANVIHLCVFKFLN